MKRILKNSPEKISSITMKILGLAKGVGHVKFKNHFTKDSVISYIFAKLLGNTKTV